MHDDLSKEELIEEMEKRRGWIKTWLVFEVMATNRELTEKALKEHIEKLSKIKEVFVFEKNFKSIEKVENPPKNVPEAYSQIAEIKLLVKNLFTLISIVVTFGPSAIEILEPKELKVKIEEVQNIANTLAGLVHQFAQAGIGGMVIQPK